VFNTISQHQDPISNCVPHRRRQYYSILKVKIAREFYYNIFGPLLDGGAIQRRPRRHNNNNITYKHITRIHYYYIEAVDIRSKQGTRMPYYNDNSLIVITTAACECVVVPIAFRVFCTLSLHRRHRRLESDESCRTGRH